MFGIVKPSHPLNVRYAMEFWRRRVEGREEEEKGGGQVESRMEAENHRLPIPVFLTAVPLPF